MKRIDVPTTPLLRVLCLLAVLAMTAQLLVLAEPAFASQILQVLWDKSVHFLFFGLMAFFLWIAMRKRRPLSIWITVLVIGAADEALQAYTPGRNSDVNDWLADGLGAAAALIIAQRSVKTGDRPRFPG
jgi:VanZ family protein